MLRSSILHMRDRMALLRMILMHHRWHAWWWWHWSPALHDRVLDMRWQTRKLIVKVRWQGCFSISLHVITKARRSAVPRSTEALLVLLVFLLLIGNAGALSSEAI